MTNRDVEHLPDIRRRIGARDAPPAAVVEEAAQVAVGVLRGRQEPVGVVE